MDTVMDGKKREITVTSVVLGVLLAVVFGAANAYLGLRVGLTVSASVPAAVISMGVMRFMLRRLRTSSGIRNRRITRTKMTMAQP